MPAISELEAAERLAKGVEKAKPSVLAEIQTELFPEAPSSTPPVAHDLARHIRGGLEAEELVDLWNVVFPSDRNVRYDEEARAIVYEKAITYDEQGAGYAD